jgi:hypothetical protein
MTNLDDAAAPVAPNPLLALTMRVRTSLWVAPNFLILDCS